MVARKLRLMAAGLCMIATVLCAWQREPALAVLMGLVGAVLLG